MANRSFKSLDYGDIPPLVHVKDIPDNFALPPIPPPPLDQRGGRQTPDLTRTGISSSSDGVFFGWVSRGKTLNILNWKNFYDAVNYSVRDSVDHDDVDHDDVEIYQLNQVFTIECNKVILCISFGKLNGESKRQCARPLSENFHKVLNFPSESGHIVATGYQGGVIDLWQVSTRTRIVSLVDHKSAVRDVQFAPNGSLLLLSSSVEGALKIWDCQDDGNLLKTLTPPQTNSHAPVITWSPDSSVVAAAGSTIIATWDVADISVYRRKCPILQQFKGHQNIINTCDFSKDGSLLLSGGNDCLLILWSTTDASILRVFRSVYPCASRFAASLIGGPIGDFAVVDAAFHPAGDHVTAVCADGTLRVWSVLDDEDDPLRASFLQKPVGCKVLGGADADGVIVVASNDGVVKLFQHPSLDVPSLQHLARKAFKRDHRKLRMDSLNLPTRMERFLKMEEFNPNLRECGCESRHHPRRGSS